jgi:hypothetical protein
MKVGSAGSQHLSKSSESLVVHGRETGKKLTC